MPLTAAPTGAPQSDFIETQLDDVVIYTNSSSFDLDLFLPIYEAKMVEEMTVDAGDDFERLIFTVEPDFDANSSASDFGPTRRSVRAQSRRTRVKTRAVTRRNTNAYPKLNKLLIFLAKKKSIHAIRFHHFE
jgi:hypothetical protein